MVFKDYISSLFITYYFDQDMEYSDLKYFSPFIYLSKENYKRYAKILLRERETVLFHSQ